MRLERKNKGKVKNYFLPSCSQLSMAPAEGFKNLRAVCHATFLSKIRGETQPDLPTSTSVLSRAVQRLLHSCRHMLINPQKNSINLHSSPVHHPFPNLCEATQGPTEHPLPCPKCHQGVMMLAPISSSQQLHDVWKTKSIAFCSYSI